MATFLLILRLLPMILAAVQAIESAIPVAGAGKTKLELLTGTVSDAWDADPSTQKDVGKDKLLQVTVSLVARAVSVLNALGVFRKS